MAQLLKTKLSVPVLPPRFPNITSCPFQQPKFLFISEKKKKKKKKKKKNLCNKKNAVKLPKIIKSVLKSLTLRMPRKTQENVICLCYVVLRHLLFIKLFEHAVCIYANNMDPDQTAPKGAVWYGSTLFATMTFKVTSRRQRGLQFAVFGILRVKKDQFQLCTTGPLTQSDNLSQRSWTHFPNYEVCHVKTIIDQYAKTQSSLCM